MKCNLFGDQLDVFKWDLSLIVTQQLKLGITYIPMLTKNDEKKGIRYLPKGWPGTADLDRLRLLQSCFNKNPLCIRNIRPLFDPSGIQFRLYLHELHNDEIYFSDEDRSNYFKGIPSDCWLSDQLLFLDPNTGLEGESWPEHKVDDYLRFCEVASLYDNMTLGSVLMIFQYFHHQTDQGQKDRIIDLRWKGLRKVLPEKGWGWSYIYVNRVAFLFVAKDDATHKLLHNVLQEYHKLYPLATNVFKY